MLRRYFEVEDDERGAREADPQGVEASSGWGTSGNIERTYSVNKGLPHEVVERMRQAYAQAAEKHLATVVQPTISKDEVVNTARVEALKMFGYTDEEIKRWATSRRSPWRSCRSSSTKSRSRCLG